MLQPFKAKDIVVLLDISLILFVLLYLSRSFEEQTLFTAETSV